MKRAAASAGSSAYQGVFEAVGAILIACAAGFWIDRWLETAPVGLLVGVVIGFGAFVLRMVRLGKELHPDSEKGRQAAGETFTPEARSEARSGAGPAIDDESADDLGTGEAPGLSDVLKDEAKDKAKD